MNLNKFLFKTSKYSGWVLLFFMILYFFTGYGSLWGVINPVRAKFVHETILPIPTIVAIILHIAFRIKIIFTKRNES